MTRLPSVHRLSAVHLSTRARRATILLAFLLLAISLLAIGTAQAGPTSPNGLVINEIYDSQSGANEYFELYNSGPAPIDLSTYTIYNHDTAIPLSRLSDPVIAAGQFRAIGPAALGTWFAGTTGIARVDFLGLTTSSPTDTVIDVVNFGGAPNPNWPNYARFSGYFFVSNIPSLAPEDGTLSLQRWPDGLDTDQGTDWAQILSSPGSASCADPNESDNTQSTSKSQAPGTSVLHRLCPAGDQDWVQVSMSSGNQYTLFAQPLPQATRVDTVMRLYDSTGALLQESNDPNSRTSVIVFRPTSSGNYYIQMTDANGAGSPGPDFLYTLTITAQVAPTSTPVGSATAGTPSPTPGADPYEPDNNMAQAKPIDLNTEQRHTLYNPPTGQDVDWIYFGATTNKVYSLYTSNLAGPVDTIITLYDRDGNFLAENDDYQPGQGLYSRIDYVFGSTNIYYLKIRDKRGAWGPNNGYTVGFSSQGGLPPTPTVTPSPTLNPNSPTPTARPCMDQYEQDGLPESANVILIGDTQHHSICPAADADWVKFYARAGKVYTIRTANLGRGLDTYMYLFDTNMRTILAQNDDGGDGVASRIDFYPLRDDWYYAQVKNAGDLGGPDETYDLNLVVVPGVPQPPSTPIIAPPVTVTSAPIPPTAPPLNTPTQGPIPPTPRAEATAPGPVPTGAPQVTSQPTAGAPVPERTSVPTVAPGGVPGVPGTGVLNGLPGVPRTGADPDAPPPSSDGPVSALPPLSVPGKPIDKAGGVGALNVPFRLWYDRNGNGTFDAEEGIRGVDVFLVDPGSTRKLAGGVTTSLSGTGTLKLGASSQGYRLYIPYLGIYMRLGDFANRDFFGFGLKPVHLPDRVP